MIPEPPLYSQFTYRQNCFATVQLLFGKMCRPPSDTLNKMTSPRPLLVIHEKWVQEVPFYKVVHQLSEQFCLYICELAIRHSLDVGRIHHRPHITPLHDSIEEKKSH